MTDYLKLTTYFGERLRSEDRFLADALLDLYGRGAVATSVVLRGIASFGPHHQLRSDQLLSMSEDPPIAVAAVDTADVIADGMDRFGASADANVPNAEPARGVARSADSSTGRTILCAPPRSAGFGRTISARREPNCSAEDSG